MFNGQIERELLDGVPWLFGQQPQLPTHLQLSADEQQQRRDTALPAAMRYIFKAESYEMIWAREKTVLHNSGKCCIWELPKENSPEPGPTKMHFHKFKSS